MANIYRAGNCTGPNEILVMFISAIMVLFIMVLLFETLLPLPRSMVSCGLLSTDFLRLPWGNFSAMPGCVVHSARPKENDSGC